MHMRALACTTLKLRCLAHAHIYSKYLLDIIKRMRICIYVRTHSYSAKTLGLSIAAVSLCADLQPISVLRRAIIAVMARVDLYE